MVHPWASARRCNAFITRVRVRTQEFDMVSPAEGDIYAILRYLALVSRRTGAGLPSPDPSCPLQILLSAYPQRLSASGWNDGPGFRIVGPDDLSDDKGTAI